MKFPKVSVIVPIFNTQPYLRQCLDSLIAQTLTEMEIICVDNGSTDGSYELLIDYARNHENVIVMKHTEGRQGGARNAAIPIAKGQYIGFVDSDDFVAPEMFETLFSIAQSATADVAICNTRTYIQGQGYGKLSLHAHVLSNKEPFTVKQCPRLLRNSTICNRLFNREFIAKHHIRFPEGLYGQDQFFVIQALTLADRIVTVPDALYFYRKNRPGSVSEYRGKDCMHVFEVWRQISDFVEQAIEDETLKRWINEARIIKYLYSYNQAGNSLKRQYFSQMKSDFRTLELESRPVLLTPTERREYQIIMRHGFMVYNAFLRLRTTYGKLRGNVNQFSKTPSERPSQ
ncbi:MAG: hypothetical protein DPW21_07575 [Anaerolineae bacterium]|nr:glycosyltransferase [Chloroflexi bacterium CFX1]MCQ3946544.1 hypothetical protein [Anaerolineae bacterium]